MNDWLIFGLLFFGAYLLGSVPAAYLGARWFGGIDLRKVGTRNIGGSNVLRSVSKWAAIPVVIFDIGKGSLVTLVAGLLGLSTGMQAAVCIAAIIGHNWPIFLGFQGGRGIATSLGVVLVLSWPIGLIVLVVSYLFAPLKQHGLGVFCAVLIMPFLGWFLAGPFGIEDKVATTLGFVAVAVVAYLRRLIHRRSELSRETPIGEVFINRLFFDRDIRNREMWLRRDSVQNSKS